MAHQVVLELSEKMKGQHMESHTLLHQLQQRLAEVTAERDLFRSQWLQLKQEMSKVMTMTPDECEEILKTGVDSKTLMAELEEILK